MLEQVHQDAALGVVRHRLGCALDRVADLAQVFRGDVREREVAQITGAIVDSFEVLIADQQVLEYFENIVGVGGVDDAGEEAVALRERVHRNGEFDAAHAEHAAAGELFDARAQ